MLQEDKRTEKRQFGGGGEEKIYDIFKKRRKCEFENYLKEKEMEELGQETETLMKSEEELRKEWEEKLQRREERIAEEEEKRATQIEKAKKIKQSYELLNLCRKTLETEGITWKKSKERRELERTRLERIHRRR